MDVHPVYSATDTGSTDLGERGGYGGGGVLRGLATPEFGLGAIAPEPALAVAAGTERLERLRERILRRAEGARAKAL